MLVSGGGESNLPPSGPAHKLLHAACWCLEWEKVWMTSWSPFALHPKTKKVIYICQKVESSALLVLGAGEGIDVGPTPLSFNPNRTKYYKLLLEIM